MHRICPFFLRWQFVEVKQPREATPYTPPPPPLPPRPLGAYHIFLSSKHLFAFSKEPNELNNFTQQHEAPSQPSNSYPRTYLVEGRGLLEEVGEARQETHVK